MWRMKQCYAILDYVITLQISAFNDTLIDLHLTITVKRA